MADIIIDDMRKKLNDLSHAINDGDRVIQFKTDEEMNRFLEYKQNVEKLYTDFVTNATK